MKAGLPILTLDAQKLVREYAVLSAASALIPQAVICTTALTGVHVDLLIELSRLYRVPFEPKTGRALMVAAIGGGVTDCVIGLPAVRRFVVAFAPVVLPVWFIGGSILAGTFTHLLGHAFIRHYEAGGTYADFNWVDFRREIVRKAGALGRIRRKSGSAPFGGPGTAGAPA